MRHLVTWFGDSARFLWDELVASAIGDTKPKHMFGVMRRESHFDHRTAVMVRVLRRLIMRERQRCDLELPVGFGTGTHKSKDDVPYLVGLQGRTDRGRSVHVGRRQLTVTGLETPDEVVAELQALRGLPEAPYPWAVMI
jgi:hypothetical protein